MLKAVQNHNNYIRYERTITVYEQHAVYDLVLLNTPNFAGQLVCPQFLPQGVQKCDDSTRVPFLGNGATGLDFTF